MARITVSSIKNELEVFNWKIVTDRYSNLETEMHFQCSEGHDIYATWGKLRRKIECPVCKQNTLLAPTTKIIPKNPKEKRILAIDQASHISGYAVFDGTSLIGTGIFKTTAKEEVARICQVKYWLVSMLENWKPDIVGLEGIQLQDLDSPKNMGGRDSIGVTTFEILARLQGVLLNVCYEYNVSHKVCPTNTWRHACGVRGRTRPDKKKSMQLLVKQWYDITVSDDIADAIGIGYYLCNLIDKFVTTENWETE